MWPSELATRYATLKSPSFHAAGQRAVTVVLDPAVASACSPCGPVAVTEAVSAMRRPENSRSTCVGALAIVARSAGVLATN